MEAEASRRPGLARLGLLAVVALSLARWLLPFAVRHAPMAVQTAVSFSTFRALSQIAIVVVVLGLARALLRSPWVTLGVRLPSRRAAIGAFLAAPIVSVVATYFALLIALPVLLDELATRGAGASQANAGAFGRELVATPIVSALVSGALLAAFAEETVFRGAFYAFARRVFEPSVADAEVSQRSPLRAFAGAWGAAIAAGVLFGVMHWDLAGGVGIVRVVSTTCLGLATGVARKISGSLIASTILHATYNVLALGTARGWFSRWLGVYWGVPVAVSCSAAIVIVAFALLALRSRARGRAVTLA